MHLRATSNAQWSPLSKRAMCSSSGSMRGQRRWSTGGEPRVIRLKPWHVMISHLHPEGGEPRVIVHQGLTTIMAWHDIATQTTRLPAFLAVHASCIGLSKLFPEVTSDDSYVSPPPLNISPVLLFFPQVRGPSKLG